ncbi:proline-rich transmembrane protein 3 [Hemicordylus capensis]|uniref:proline-rich transmembrane protein 3 n=1 Tax=Hemicordylus capensis TaxID=884348 RepID=UPI002302E32D|nr:proline-rich transmembrane protein 3 [Hemicordylus capensis]XP_053157472.1 proline-rich transmembrane protein 3 [Hemicordylus capensis]XP_053157473.1 proline-rich transmembrane protein 3 [Hemicordylus capensis]XP_053157474.1 proline-rich transmembrane protein 3 [Hemicordylus capensis]
MAAMGLFFAWHLLLPVLLQAFRLPTPDGPAWDPSLSSVPGLPLLNGPFQESLPSAPPAVPHSDPYAHELSSGDGEPSDENWRGASPTAHPGTPITTVTLDLPAVTSSGLGTPPGAPEGSPAPHLIEGLPQGGDFLLPAVGPSGVEEKPQDIGQVTVELSPEQGKDELSLSRPSTETTSIAVTGTASSSVRVEASGLPASQEKTTHSHLQAVPKDVAMVTTLSSRPTVSTIPLVMLTADGSPVKWMATEGTTDTKGSSSIELPASRVPQQELLGRNQTTVKYLASFRSTQAYGGPQGREDLATSPFRPTQAVGYTQSPWKGTVPIASTSQTPPLASTAVSLDEKGHGLPALPVSSHQPTSQGFFPSPSTPSPAGGMAGTQRPVERITHWGLIIDTTQRVGPRDMAGTQQIHPHGSSVKPSFTNSADSGAGRVVDADPQRVRGAVIPKIPVTYVGSFTPGTSVVGKGPGARQTDAVGTRPPGQSSTTTSARLLATPRRGLIRVTTQRVLQHPQLARPEPSLPATLPASNPPCSRPGSACSQLLPNQTLLRWADLERTLNFAWALHVYGSGVLFLLLSLLSLACLVGSLAVHVPHLLCVMGASALLLVFGVLRATFFLVDPYGSRGWLPTRAVRVLYTAPFPLLLSTFAVLLLRLLRQARLQVLPPKFQSLPLLAVLGSMQSIVLLGADLFSPPLHPSVAVGLHTLSCSAGFGLLPATIFVYWRLRRNVVAEGTPEPGVWSGAWVLLASSGLALPCCGLQLYGVLWLSGLLFQPDVFTWGWWFVQFWFRIGELVLSLTLLFLAWQALCQRCGSSDHSCWVKLMRYFCTYRKAEVPEYPNNCYDWTGGILEKVPNNDISKNLIRNPPSSGRLWALKDSNELRAAVGQGSSPSPVRPVYSPKCPNAAAAAMGRSYTSICFERDSVLSLAELEFRPPSPINLSRSIDEALFREHLVRDSIFLRSSLHFPSRLARQDSCSSLRGDCSTLSHTAQPLLARPRRSSDPDCLYSLARASSMGELTTQSRGLVSEPPTDTSFDSFSHTTFSRASLKISWNPWRHGLSSPESLPPEELPNQSQMLPDELPPAPSNSAPNSEREARKSFLALSKQVDSRSLSSDTIEL